ncbi:MAG: hypothetical protein D6692_00860 [Planctomycetota bacterium]|nr:MAG: hypothetical protein D6692_00860 [Planctomycetota bacterium]
MIDDRNFDQLDQDDRIDGQPGEDAPACGRELTSTQERAIVAMLSEPSIAAAAKKVGIGERTLHRWLREEPFAGEYRRARREAFGQAIALTQRSAAAAVATLLRVMHDPKATWSSRVAAATHVLKFARESIELDDLASRIDGLETRLAEDAA